MKEFVEKLIGRLEELKSNPNEKTCRENILLAMQKNLTIYSAIEIVNQLEEEYNNGWIPCEKELPKEAKLYEVTIEKTICSKKQYITDYRLFGTENEWISADKVIAWREKVEPFQKGE